MKTQDRHALVPIGLMMLLVLPVWLGIVGPMDWYTTLKDFQTLLGSGIALVAATLAYRGAMATLKMNLNIREEDRIERILPGLKGARNWIGVLLDHIQAYPRRSQVIELLSQLGIAYRDKATIARVLERDLPLTDVRTRKQIELRLGGLCLHLEDLSESDQANGTDTIMTEPPSPAYIAQFDSRVVQYDVLIELLRDLQQRIARRVETDEARAERYRTRIARYLDGD